MKKKYHKEVEKAAPQVDADEAKFKQMCVLMRNIINAVDNSDSTALEQSAAAGREFLDKNPA
jgi:hypothetical protein